MKNKLFQLYAYVSTIDRRYVQYAYLAYMLAVFVLRVPDDGSGGTR